MVIPSTASRFVQRRYDTHAYKERHLVECFFVKFKLFQIVDNSYAFGCNELFRKAPSDMQIHVHSIVAIHCAIREFVDVGDHYFYICDVENVYTMWMKSHCSLGKVIPRSF